MSDLFNPIVHDTLRSHQELFILADGLTACKSGNAATITQRLKELFGSQFGPAIEVKLGPSPADSFWIWRSPPELFVFHRGLASVTDFVETILNSGQVNFAGGKLMKLFADRVNTFGDTLLAAITSALSSVGGPYTRLILCGHSAGGGDFVGFSAKVLHPPVPTLLVTFGMPRVVNPTLAAQLESEGEVIHVRVHNSLDYAPQIPPELWPLFIPPAVRWAHTGAGLYLQPDGDLLPNDEDPSFPPFQIAGLLTIPAVVSEIAILSHAIAEYAARLVRSVPPAPLFTLPIGGPNMPVQIQVETTIVTPDSAAPGWTEGYYLDQAASIEHALNRAYTLALLRAFTMGGPAPGLTYIKQLRVSDIGISGDSLVLTRKNPAVGGGFDGSAGPSDISTTCLLLRCESTSLYRRPWMFAGIPDDLVEKGGQLANPLPVGWLGAFNSWRDAMLAPQALTAPFGNPGGVLGNQGIASFRVREKNLPTDITGVTLAAGKATVTTAPNNHGLNVGDRIKVSGIVWDPTGSPIDGFNDKGPRGEYFVASTPAPTSTTFTLASKRPKLGLFTGEWRSGGKVYKSPFVLVPFTQIEIEEPRSRRRGRDPNRPVGRRKARTPI